MAKCNPVDLRFVQTTASVEALALIPIDVSGTERMTRDNGKSGGTARANKSGHESAFIFSLGLTRGLCSEDEPTDGGRLFSLVHGREGG